MMIKEQEVEECDATKMPAYTERWYQKLNTHKRYVRAGHEKLMLVTQSFN